MKRKFLTALLAIFCAVCLTMFSACDLLSDFANGNDDQGTEQTDGGDASGGSSFDSGNSSAEHTHILVKTAAKEATCYSEGNIEYWTCSICGKYFADSDAKTEIESEDTILSVSHTYDGSWTCTICGNTLTESEGLEYYEQGDKCYVSIGTCTDNEIVIPYTHNGLPVTLISSFHSENVKNVYIPDSITYIYSEAFCGCTSLKTVNIPKNVSYIGEAPFSACSSLTNITVDEENEYYKSVDGNLYSYDGTVLVQYALGKPETSFTIPEGVTKINAGTFTSVDEYMEFYADCSLTEVITPDSMTTISKGAFILAATLSSIVLSDSVTTIEDRAFELCVSLISFTIPKNVTTIADDFEYCYKLVEIYNLSSVTLTKSDFSSTCNIKNIYTASSGQSNLVNQDGYIFYNDNGSYYLAGYIGTETSLILPETINGKSYALYDYAFMASTKITSVVIPDGITSISECCFVACMSLEKASLPNSVKSIGAGAFEWCTSLKEINIPDGIKTIKKYTFYCCASLESITVPDSLTSIGEYAFEDCGAIKELNISTTDLSAWCRSSKLTALFNLMSSTSYLNEFFSEVFGDGDQSFYNLYYNGELLTNLVITDGVTSICEGAFAFCSSITSVTIPSSVTSIDDGAFYCCDNLTSMTFEDASGWYVSETKGAASGTSVSVTNASKNAEYLTDTYGMYYWYKK